VSDGRPHGALRPEVPPLLVELLDVCLEDGQGERVERQDVLSVLGLAVCRRPRVLRRWQPPPQHGFGTKRRAPG
jgi:hypothetical protein